MFLFWTVIQRTLHELFIWSLLRNSHIHQLFGFLALPDNTISIVAKSIPGGDAHDYVRFPRVDIPFLVR